MALSKIQIKSCVTFLLVDYSTERVNNSKSLLEYLLFVQENRLDFDLFNDS